MAPRARQGQGRVPQGDPGKVGAHGTGAPPMLDARAMQPGRTGFLDTLPETRRPFLWLAVLCLALWLPGFFTVPPSDRDESRFAQATRQMVDSGDYVRLAVGQEERNKKPVGIHWAQAAVVHALEAVGVPARAHIAAYRLPSLIGALLGVLATFHWGRALVGRRAAFVAAAMLAPCMVLVVEAHIAKTDAALLATIAAAMGLFGRAYLAPQVFSSRQAAAFWAVLGIGVLLKGPIAPMVPLFAGVTLAIVDRSAPWLRALRLPWGIPLMIAMAAPWFVAIGIATEGRFFAEAVGQDMIGKVNSGAENHWGPPGLYTLIFGITAFPSAWIVMRALPSMWTDRLRPEVRFLLAWIVPVWLLFEALPTKLPHYVLPAFPALMLLGARWAMDPLRREPPRWLRIFSNVTLVGVALGLGAVALGAAVMLERRPPVLAAGAAALLAGAALAWFTLRASRGGQYGRAALLGAILAVPVYLAVLEGVLPRLSTILLSPRIAAEVERIAPGLPADRFGIVGYHEPSLLFARGGATRLLQDGRAAAAFLAEAPGRVVAVEGRQEAAFRAEAQARGLSLREVGLQTGQSYVRGRTLALQFFDIAP